MEQSKTILILVYLIDSINRVKKLALTDQPTAGGRFISLDIIYNTQPFNAALLIEVPRDKVNVSSKHKLTQCERRKCYQELNSCIRISVIPCLCREWSAHLVRHPQSCDLVQGASGN